MFMKPMGRSPKEERRDTAPKDARMLGIGRVGMNQC